MEFGCNGNTPCFSFPEIEDIYRNATEKNTDALRETAHRLFPNRDPIMYENLSMRKGFGRAFEHEGEYKLPKWTIIAYPGFYGVMEDDTIYPFCDPKYYRRNNQ